MIEEITFKNVLSFKEENSFSFEATSDTTFESQHVVTMPNGTRLLKLGIVYGPNAGGKSNLLYAISMLRDFMVYDPQNMDEPTGFEQFMLDKATPSMPSEYSIKFWVDGIRYWYQLKATRQQVLHEKLSYYKTTQPIKVFERVLEDGQSVLSFNPAVQKIRQEEQKALTLNCLPNKSFFAARGRVNVKMEHVDIVRAWIRDKFMPMVGSHTSMEQMCLRKMREDAGFKDYVLEFMRKADFNITDIDVIPKDHNGHAEIDSYKENNLVLKHTVETESGQDDYDLSPSQESEGVMRIMGLEAAIYEAVKNDSILLIDQIESSLYPALTELIIQDFIVNSNESQMLLTTHYTGILKTIDDLVRKDNIWFVDKDRAGASHLYSLVEFNGLNKISNMENAYLHGQFGAIPNI